MKKKFDFKFNYFGFAMIFIIGAVMIISSCHKKDDLGGIPKINRVYILDTLQKHKDSSIVGAEPGKLLVINGENLGGIVKTYINNYASDFNTNYNTSNNLIIYIPNTVTTDSTGNNKIRIVTTHGEASFDFKIIALANIYAYNKHTFGKGRGDITFKGKNFADVTNVDFVDATTPIPSAIAAISLPKTPCLIVSKSPDKLVVRIPPTNISRVALLITNSSGVYFLYNQGSDEFVNADVALQIYTDSIATKFSDNSWGAQFVKDSINQYAGKYAVAKTFAAGNWHQMGFNNWWPKVPYDASYKYITFSIKGGSVLIPFWIISDASKSGFPNFNDKNKFDVPPKGWSYYKLLISDLDFWYPGTTLSQLGFRLQGPAVDETIELDDLMLVK